MKPYSLKGIFPLANSDFIGRWDFPITHNSGDFKHTEFRASSISQFYELLNIGGNNLLRFLMKRIEKCFNLLIIKRHNETVLCSMKFIRHAQNCAGMTMLVVAYIDSYCRQDDVSFKYADNGVFRLVTKDKTAPSGKNGNLRFY